MINERVRGSLIGGAVGDALGFPLEFLRVYDIRDIYGSVREMILTDGIAQISDDTQMTLYTACGVLYSDTTCKLGGGASDLTGDIYSAYLDWLDTQQGSALKDAPRAAWIYGVRELNMRRAPGNTCISALSSGEMGSIDAPLNNSKGCGGVMRVAPIGLYFSPESMPTDDMIMLGAHSAAITHGHPLGYISAAGAAYIINQLVYGAPNSLENIVRQCVSKLSALFGESAAPMNALLERAIELSYADMEDTRAIFKLGEGWVGEEALAIAVYCCLKHPHNFQDAVCAAVNHSGDSDSTGAIAGNIIGAALGASAIPASMTQNLELLPLITQLADDLASGVPAQPDARWLGKYLTPALAAINTYHTNK